MAASKGSSESYKISSMVRGYHQYQSIWNAVDGEELPCRVKLSKTHDLFAVAVCKSEIVVGHVPKKISSICSSFWHINLQTFEVLFSRISQNPWKPRNFCPSKISSYMVVIAIENLLARYVYRIEVMAKLEI